MGTWATIGYVVLLLIMVFMMYNNIRRNPEWLTKESFSKSFYVMGILALILIGFVGLCVLFLRHTG